MSLIIFIGHPNHLDHTACLSISGVKVLVDYKSLPFIIDTPSMEYWDDKPIQKPPKHSSKKVVQTTYPNPNRPTVRPMRSVNRNR